MDKKGLWFKVLSYHYGEDSGWFIEGGRDGSSWWREVVQIRDGLGVEGGSWFEESIQKKADNDFNTYFWIDTFVGSVPLRDRFMRLFDLTTNKDVSAAKMSSLG